MVCPSDVAVVVASRSRTLGRALLRFRHGATRAQAVDVISVKSQLPEDDVVMLAEVRRTPRRLRGDAVHLNRAADRRGQLAADAFERDVHVICGQLRIVDYLLRSAYCAERDV